MATAKTLLENYNFKYVLLGCLQTDDLEGEFGKYRQLSGGCYYISVEQVLMSARMRKLALFNKLEIADVPHLSANDCCSSDFTEEELSLLDNSIDNIDSITPEEDASLYYICGYVAKKENYLPKYYTDGSDSTQSPASESAVACCSILLPGFLNFPGKGV